jgi:MYXO-CTERM domain-containing protein
MDGMRKNILVSALGVSLTAAGAAHGATLQVGPGLTYTTPCAAIAAAQPNDEVDVAMGTYTDSCEINVAGLTVKGVGGQPTIDLSATNHPADYKGIYVISADDVRIENLELTGANVDDSEGGNGAGLRVTGHGLVVHGCNIHDNQEGILAAPLVDGGTITIEYTELSHNGLGDACDNGGGCVHNVYISENGTIRYDTTIFQFNWSHDLASDTADKGHLLKSRSRETDVLYNRITGETGHDSYEVDIPNAGLGIVVGNVIEKGTTPDNSILLDYGEEGIDPGQQTTLYVAYNTFVNDFTSGTFIDVASGATLTAHDNIFFGPGTPASTGALSVDNLSGTDPLFVDPSMYDYHLMSGSPAIGMAVDPGMGGTTSLTPIDEYVQPLLSVARLTAHDLGAFELGTNTMGAGMDGGGGASDGGTRDGGGATGSGDGGSGSPDGGSTTDGGGDGGANAESPTGTSSGCGCVVAGDASAGGEGLVSIVALAGALTLRRRRARPST